MAATTKLAICSGLALVIALVFGRVIWEQYGFVDYDDGLYVVYNPMVLSGLTWQGVRWAFNPTTQVAANYHPVTLLSHMLDCQMYGLARPWGHHLSSLLWHAAAACMLFLALLRMTSRVWPCALVAALFAWHPLHVESVAWVSERKDVMSAFFWFLAMWCYVGYVRGSRLQYWGVAISMALGLLSKPMVVTLPFVLLLLDFWPLGRISPYDWRSPDWRRAAGALIWEKLPLFAMVACSIGLTLYAQSTGGAVVAIDAMPLVVRIVNALHSYNMYLAKTFWPTGLAAQQSMGARTLTIETAVLGCLGFAIVTYLAISWGRARPYLPVGWFWYVGTLVPVIGLVQVGEQSMADRYTYIPLVGIFIAIAFWLVDAVRDSARQRLGAAVATCAILAILAGMAARQVGYWSDTITLFGHSVAVNPKNGMAQFGLAVGYWKQGDRERAWEALQEGSAVETDFGMAWLLIGALAMERGDLPAASKAFGQSTTLRYHEPESLAFLGWTRARQGKRAESQRAIAQALELGPSNFVVLVVSGIVALEAGSSNEAMAYFRQAQELNPGNAPLLMMMARLSATGPDPNYRFPSQAVQIAEFVCQKAPPGSVRPYWLDTLAAAYAAVGRYDEAVQTAERALTLAEKKNRVELAKVIGEHLASFRRQEALSEPPASIRADDIFDRELLLFAEAPGLD
ncbi:MAG: tetratricopeptide repeat protein [Pirellulales bacterium]|nr:tetratricopeptide repeat protein [Pirellulales bacterium]